METAYCMYYILGLEHVIYITLTENLCSYKIMQLLIIIQYRFSLKSKIYILLVVTKIHRLKGGYDKIIALQY